MLENVERTGRQTMDELRQVLGVLRDDDGGALAVPLPTLADLSGARRRRRRPPGPPDVTGEPDQVPAGVAVSVYRIVQEALTNANRHAGPGATVDVRVDVRGRRRRRSSCPTTAAARRAAQRRRRLRPRRDARAGDGGRRLVHAPAPVAAAGGGSRATIPFQPTAVAARRRPVHTGLVIRIALVDDQAMVRQGLRMILEAEDGITVVGEAADGLARRGRWCPAPGPTSC